MFGRHPHAARVLSFAGEAGLAGSSPLCADAQVTVGSALLRRGYWITEAHGDQPGDDQFAARPCSASR
jgi:hypothetical protein